MVTILTTMAEAERNFLELNKENIFWESMVNDRLNALGMMSFFFLTYPMRSWLLECDSYFIGGLSK